MLNLTRLHLGIAHESQFQELGISSVAAILGGTRGQPASALPNKRLRKNNREGTEDNRRNPRKRQSSASDYAAFGTRDASGPTKAGSAAAPNRCPGENVMNTLLCKILVTRASEIFLTPPRSRCLPARRNSPHRRRWRAVRLAASADRRTRFPDASCSDCPTSRDR